MAILILYTVIFFSFKAYQQFYFKLYQIIQASFITAIFLTLINQNYGHNHRKFFFTQLIKV